MLKNISLITLFLLFTSQMLIGKDLDSLYRLEPTQSGIEQVNTLNKIARLELAIKGIEVAEKALQKSIKLDYYEGKLLALETQFLKYDELGLFPKALDLAKEILAYEQVEGTKKKEVDAYYNLGGIYGDLGEYDKEFSSHYQGLILATEIGDEEGIAIGQSRLAGTYSYTIQNYEKSHKLGMAAYDYFENYLIFIWI